MLIAKLILPIGVGQINNFNINIHWLRFGAMGLGHYISPVLSTHVNLLCKDANKLTQFFVIKKCLHWGSAMHARQRWLDTGTLQHAATAIVLVKRLTEGRGIGP